MNTHSVWSVRLESLAAGDRIWKRHFLGRPSRRNIQDALRAEQADPHVNVDVFVDLADRLPLNYAPAAQTERGHAICAAEVVIGLLHLTSIEAYEI